MYSHHLTSDGMLSVVRPCKTKFREKTYATNVGALLHLNCSNAVDVGLFQRMNGANTNLAGFVWPPEAIFLFIKEM
jgi:hypothetical protein